MTLARRRLLAPPRRGSAPADFATRCGGGPASGVPQADKVDIGPDAWQIMARRLSPHDSREVHRRWAPDIPGHMAAAEAHRAGIAHV
jgi:hypothetical protein